MPALVNFTIYRGTATTLRYTVKDASGALVNVGGWHTSFTARTTPQAADPAALGPVLGTIVGDGSLGQIDVALTLAQTLALAVQQYTCSLARTDSGSEDLLAIGTMTAKYDVLHPASS